MIQRPTEDAALARVDLWLSQQRNENPTLTSAEWHILRYDERGYSAMAIAGRMGMPEWLVNELLNIAHEKIEIINQG